MVLLNNEVNLYTVDVAYLKELHSVDKEVYYDKNYENKPFVGIIVTQNDYNYFVPLTSAKPKHVKWPNVSDRHFLIFEEVAKSAVRPHWVYKDLGNGKVKHIFAALDVKKMIPVPDGLFRRIDFNTVPNPAYKYLLEQEYRIILSLQDEIVKTVSNTYNAQKESSYVREFHCNYSVLEKVCDKYHAVDVDFLIADASERSERTGTSGKSKNEYTLV